MASEYIEIKIDIVGISPTAEAVTSTLTLLDDSGDTSPIFVRYTRASDEVITSQPLPLDTPITIESIEGFHVLKSGSLNSAICSYLHYVMVYIHDNNSIKYLNISSLFPAQTITAQMFYAITSEEETPHTITINADNIEFYMIDDVRYEPNDIGKQFPITKDTNVYTAGNSNRTLTVDYTGTQVPTIRNT